MVSASTRQDGLVVRSHASAAPTIPYADTLLIRRPALEESIMLGLAKRLLLIVAPPGYGKTTGLHQVFSRCRHPVVWHSVVSGETTALRAVERIRQAIELHSGTGQPPLPPPPARDSEYAAYIIRLLEQTLAGPCHIVFDSIDRSSRPKALLELIQHLVDDGPADSRVVIASASRPSLALAGVARRDGLCRIGKRELSLSLEETEQLLALHWGEEPARRLAPEIHRISGGCVANVGLALIAWRSPPERSDHLLRAGEHGEPARPSDMLRATGPAERVILGIMSLLPEFTAELVTGLCEGECAGEQVSGLLRRVAVATTTGDGRYVLAPALADVVRRELVAVWPTERIRAVRRRAAEAAEAWGDKLLAVDLYLEADAFSEAARALDRMEIRHLAVVDCDRVSPWATRFESGGTHSAATHFVCATAKRFAGDFAGAIPHYKAALSGDDGALSVEDRLAVLAPLYRLQVNLDEGDAPLTRAALFALEGDTALARGRLHAHRSFILATEGRLADSLEEMRQAMSLLRSSPLRRDALYRLALLELKRGNYQSAHHCLAEYLADPKSLDSMSRFNGLYLLATLHGLRGELAFAEARHRDALAAAKASSGLATFHATLALASSLRSQGRLDEAADLIQLAECRSLELNAGEYIRVVFLHAKAMLLQAMGEVDEAVSSFRQIVTLPLNEPYFEGWLQLDAATTYLQAGYHDAARPLVEKAYRSATDMGAPHLQANAAMVLEYLAELTGRHDEAASLGREWRSLVTRGRFRHMPACNPELMTWMAKHASPASRDCPWTTWGSESTHRRPVTGRIPEVEVRTLGRFELMVDREALDGTMWRGSRKARLLLQLLLSRDSLACSTDEIIECLWPREVPAGGRSAVHATVWALRKVLRTQGLDRVLYPRLEHGFYRLAVEPSVTIEHVAYRTLVRRGKRLVQDDEIEAAHEVLRRATDLWQGDYLPDCLYERFSEHTRQGLFELHSSALRTLGVLSAELGMDPMVWWRKAIQHDRYDEEAYKGYLAACAAGQCLREARVALRRLKEAFVDDLGLPLPHWAALYEKGVSAAA